LEKNKVMCISVKEFLVMDAKGFIEPYKHNRGTREGEALKINKKVLQNFKERQFNEHGFGMITGALGEGKLHLIDGHSRLDALKKFLDKVDLDDPIYECDILVSAGVPFTKEDMIAAYADLNSGQSHNGRAKVLNPDLYAGAMLASFFEKIGIDPLPEDLHQPLYHLLYAYQNREGRDLTYTFVWHNSKKADRLKGTIPKEKFTFSPETLSFIGAGVKFYLDLLSRFEKYKENNVSRKDLQKALDSVGLFTFIVLDFSRVSSVLKPQSPKRVLELIDSLSFRSLENLCSLLSRRSTKHAEPFSGIENIFSVSRRRNN
jgi:hypothetical protein